MLPEKDWHLKSKSVGDGKWLCPACGKRATREVAVLRPCLHKLRGVCWWIALGCVVGWLVLSFIQLDQKAATVIMIGLLVLGVGALTSWFVLGKFRPFTVRCRSCGSLFWPDGAFAQRPSVRQGQMEAGVAPERIFRAYYRHRCPFCRRRTPTRVHVLNQALFDRHRKLVLVALILWISVLFGWLPIGLLFRQRAEVVVGPVTAVLFVTALSASFAAEYQHVERIAHLECDVCHSHYPLPRSSYIRLGGEVL